MAGKTGIFKEVGLLRVIWGVIVVLCVLMVFFADGNDAGWRVIPAYVAPVLVVLNIWGLFLDLLISWLFMRQNHAQERLRYRNIMAWDGLMVVLLFIFWGPFFGSLFAGS